MANERRRIAADIGGTFTDIAYLTEDGRLATRKVPSTPADYAEGVVSGLRELARQHDLPLASIEEVLHGCTVATNAILEHKGAKTALLTTKGFRDVLELRRIRVPRLYEPLYVKPPPLVPRHLRFEVEERVDAKGGVVRPLQMGDVEAAIQRIREAGVEAVAVCFLHAYANPAHEEAVGELLRRALPDLFISLSVEVLPQIREYERTSTTVINAYVGPPVGRYLASMVDRLRDAGVPGRLMVMQSSGGILEASTVIKRPAEIVECGPAAGVVGAGHFCALTGHRNLITLDMGGTTAKAAIIEDGNLLYADEYEVGTDMSTGGPLAGGGGYALKLPVIDISEVGAGGGSIVWLDKAGSIKVGPKSAGAVPGPACYDMGGEQPTVTDANVVLGYLNPTQLVGGELPIRAELSHRVIERDVATPLGRTVRETAYGIHTVVNANMMRAVKAVTTYRGRDPRSFALFAFGGNGGVHGVELARVLQIGQVIVPPASGVFSAAGLLFANMEMNLSRAFLRPLRGVDLSEMARIYDQLSQQIAGEMGYAAEAISFQRQADMRYGGQAFELTIGVPDGVLDEAALETQGEAFEAEHEKRYGHRFTGEYPLELVNLRLVGTVVPEGERELRPVGHDATMRESVREVYFGPEIGARETAVIGRAALTASPRQGPFIVEEYEGTTVVPPDCTGRRDDAGSIVIDVGAQA